MNNNKNWRGYDLEELRIKQATTALRIEIEKQKLKSSASQSFGFGRGAEGTDLLGTATRMAQTVNYGLRAFRLIKNIAGVFKGLSKKHQRSR